MSDANENRRPVAFRLDNPDVVVVDGPDDNHLFSRGSIRITPQADPQSLPVLIDDVAAPRPGFRWGVLFWSALGGLIVLGAGLSLSNLVADLFNRSEGLGWLGAGLSALAAIAFAVIAIRETMSVIRLKTIEDLHRRATAAVISDNHAESRAIVQELVQLAKSNPVLARARQNLQQYSSEIIDGADLIRLAERELMTPLDQEARRLVSVAAQRVSIVTAVSPRAVIDILFVLAAALRLTRQLARLYGGRPGTLGMLTLIRHALSHLAITGGMAASDSIMQQVLGQGVAAKLSTRLGEGMLNGLLTARFGLAAIDVIRPLPFTALPRPSLTALAKELIRKRDETSAP